MVFRRGHRGWGDPAPPATTSLPAMASLAASTCARPTTPRRRAWARWGAHSWWRGASGGSAAGISERNACGSAAARAL